MSTGAPVQAISEQVRDRVQWPALFLVANAVLNLLVAFLQVCLLVAVSIAPAEEGHRFQRQLWQGVAERFPTLAEAQLQALNQADPQTVKRQGIFSEAVTSVLMIVPGLLALAGGVRMYQLRSWPLALVGSLASTVPCLAAVSCCCVGELVGIWCVAVLIRPEVRDAFR